MTYRITPDNARAMAAKSWEARRKRAHEQAEQALTALAMPQQVAEDPFILSRLVRVRKQLDRIDGMIERETDPMKLDRLASAQARLAEQERLLAGRPMPGSLKPKSASTKGPTLAQQSDPEPIGPQ
jgi:hypothetical protein